MFGANSGGHAVVWSSFAAIFLGLTALWWQNWRRRKMLLNAIPSQWRAVGEVGELTIYPLKSGRGKRITEAECTDMGIRTIDGLFKFQDRMFLIYTEKNCTFVTARQYPKMVLITTSLGRNGKITFEAPEATSKLEINLPDSSSQPKICSLWYGETAHAVDCGDEAAAWFSECIKGKGQTGLRLGFFSGSDRNTLKRISNTGKWLQMKKYFTKIRSEDYGIYSDMASFMLIGANSVAELNTRLATPVTAAHFRPTIVVLGSEPYEEDSWDWIKIGNSAVFRGVKPCTRCIFTTINPESGVMDRETKEPMTTLKKYRCLTDPAAVAVEGDSPVMGLYMGLHVNGVIKTGDKVFVGVNN